MKILDFIDIATTPPKRIELLQGDLSDIPKEFAIDLLIVSAFPGDYLPTSSSLIGALHKKGLDVSALAARKERDLRKDFSCWLSERITPPSNGLRFNRVLCFEPHVRGKPPEVVGDVFRALTPILAEKSDISSVAMPVLAAGDQGYSISTMLTPLLEASIHWMEIGLPLQCIRIVVHSDDQAEEAKRTFSHVKENYGPTKPASKLSAEYDVFISYARENTAEMEAFERSLLKANPDLRIFLDRKEIDIGSPWQSELFESLDHCRKILVILSPDYLKSKICREEFNIAWIRSREADEDIIFPVYVYTAELPTYMRYRNYFDCREGDEAKIEQASGHLTTLLEVI